MCQQNPAEAVRPFPGTQALSANIFCCHVQRRHVRGLVDRAAESQVVLQSSPGTRTFCLGQRFIQSHVGWRVTFNKGVIIPTWRDKSPCYLVVQNYVRIFRYIDQQTIAMGMTRYVILGSYNIRLQLICQFRRLSCALMEMCARLS